MLQSLVKLRNNLTLVVLLSFLLTPVITYSFIEIINLRTSFHFFQTTAGLAVPGIFTLLSLWIGVYTYRFLNPVFALLKNDSTNSPAPDAIRRHMQAFGTNYWLFFLLYVLLIPTVHHWVMGATSAATPNDLMQFILLHLVIAVLTGLPGYFYAINALGIVSRYIGLDHVHVSLKTKIMLIGCFVPLLMLTIAAKYYWWKTGFLNHEFITVYALLAALSFIVTWLCLRGVTQALAPVQKVTLASGASTYQRLAERLTPHSTDEIGLLVQTLGKLFKRLGDQEQHVHAIVEHAAEGIFILDDVGNIETFNPAAQNLFGYTIDEVRGNSINWLIPNFNHDQSNYAAMQGTHEVTAKHKNGRKLIMSVRINQMTMDNQHYYNCLISDISDRKAYERMLIDAEARYRDLVETAHDLVWRMDNRCRWTYLNTAVTHIYGYEACDMLFKHYSQFQAPESRLRDEKAWQSLLEGKELLGYETVHLDSNNKKHHLSFNARPTLNDDGSIAYITGTARDITAQKAYETELTYQAQHDSLTGLFNRNYFQQELERLVTRVARSAAECAVFYLDLDQFKYVNDTLGHAAGDRLLIDTTNLLRSNIREGDLLSRFGGDEFTILLYNINPVEVAAVAENLRLLFENYQFIDSGKAFNVTISIGATCITNKSVSADDVLSQADLACNLAKSQGRNCVHIYDEKENEKDGLTEDMGWASRVRDAYENDRFSLVFQPIFSIADHQVHDYEVLLRMRRDNGDAILPGGFMPAAERFGLVHNVDRWAVSRAMIHLADIEKDPQFITTNTGHRDIHFAINLSGMAFEDRELLPMIRSLLNETKLDPSRLTFEITETAAIANLRAASKFIGKLKDLGCQFALDDFGSGFCSFSYLKQLPVDKLKIDGSFVQGLANTPVDQAMVQSMNQIAHALGKQTIAEFVENKETLNLLREYGVDYAQGNFLGKPQAHVRSVLLN